MDISSSVNLIIFIVLTIIVFIIQHVKKKKIQRENLKYKIVKEQFRLADEQLDIMFSEFFDAYCEKLDMDRNSLDAELTESLLLKVRKESDDLIKTIIYNNNLATRKGDAWILYKQSKKIYILNHMVKYVKNVWRGDLMSFSYEYGMEKCHPSTQEIYLRNIEPILENIRNVSLNKKEFK